MVVYDMESAFYQTDITDSIFRGMIHKSFPTNCTTKREDLSYLHLLHIGFDLRVHEGELIVHKELAADVLNIFYQLYENKYPIEKIKLIDEYEADDHASMRDNNSSGFNFRKIANTNRLSNHSMGRAIDINPLYNPYVRYVNNELVCDPKEGMCYMDRQKEFPYKIDRKGICYQLFCSYGFTWGGDWKNSLDYQHFERI